MEGSVLSVGRGRVGVLVACVLFCGACREAERRPLTGEWQYRAGFDAAWLEQGPGAGAGWTRVMIPQVVSDIKALRGRSPVTLRRLLPAGDIALRSGQSSLALDTSRVSDVASFYVNKRFIGRLGAMTPYESGLERRDILLIPPELLFKNKDNYLFVVLESPGGRPLMLGETIAIGPPEVLYRAAATEAYEVIVFLVFYLAVGLYYVLIALLRHQEKSNAYFGAAVLLACSYWFFGQACRQLGLFPGDPGFVRYNLELISLFLTIPPFMLFCASLFPDDSKWPRALSGAAWTFFGLGILMSLSVVVAPYEFKRRILSFWQLLMVPNIVFVVVFMARAALTHGLQARLIFVAVMIVSATAIHDLLLATRIIATPFHLARYGFAAMVAAAAALLAGRFTMAQTRAEDLNRELEGLNRELEFKVSSRTAQLEASLTELKHRLRTEAEVVKLTEVISNRAVQRLMVQGRTLLFSSATMQALVDHVEQAAAGSQPALILGETGTGKELIARLIHEQSRLGHPFVAVNCAATPPALWEDEVFGHVRGAFTDAGKSRAGRIEEAGQGSLFFDEIGEMPLDMQAKMLRLLQEREFYPVGGSQMVPVRCRFVFATNRNLEEMIRLGTFRDDLYYRINVFRFHLPPLRERAEDIPALVDVFLQTYGPEFRTNITELEPDAMAALSAYPFPGNIRELENVILRAVAVARGDRLTLADLNLPQSGPSAGRLPLAPVDTNSVLDVGLSLPGDFHEVMSGTARHMISIALSNARGNRSQAARALGLHRSSLDYRMKELKLDPKDFEPRDETAAD